MPAPSPYRALQTTGLAGSHDCFGLKLRYEFRRTKINRQEDEYM